jgi:hypothetical protein
VHQFIELKRLGDEIRCAAFDCVDGVLHRPVSRNDDADNPRIALEGGLDHPRSVDAWHPQIRDDNVEGELLQELNGLFAAVSLLDLESAFVEALGHQGSQGGLVVYEEEVKHRQ